MIIIAIVCTVIAGFGFGCIAAFYVHSVKTRNALPAWASQRDAAGNFHGK
jgi:hypothetical protein